MIEETTMSDNVQAVQEIYAAFGRGDIEFILNQLADDVEWLSIGPAELPHAGTWHGRDGVLKFFQAVGDNFVFDSFEPQEYIASGDNVVVLGAENVHGKHTGRATVNKWTMLFTLADGKVTRYRNAFDTAAMLSILR